MYDYIFNYITFFYLTTFTLQGVEIMLVEGAIYIVRPRQLATYQSPGVNLTTRLEGKF